MSMPTTERSDVATGLLLFLLGAASGAVVALLCAPASGRESRQYIGRRAREAREQAAVAASKARDLMHQGTDAMVTSLDQWRSRMNSVIDQGRDVLDHGTETVSVAIEQGREAYQRAKEKDLA
jgi:gas vesicle protein